MYCTQSGWSRPQAVRKASTASWGTSGPSMTWAGSPDMRSTMKAKVTTAKMVIMARRRRESTKLIISVSFRRPSKRVGVQGGGTLQCGHHPPASELARWCGRHRLQADSADERRSLRGGSPGSAVRPEGRGDLQASCRARERCKPVRAYRDAGAN